MHAKLRLAAFALLLVAALAASTSVSAQSFPPLSSGYSASAPDSDLGDACDVATAIVEAHCRFHGTITTSLYDCRNVLSEDGVHLELQCWCKASTRFCIP